MLPARWSVSAALAVFVLLTAHAVVHRHVGGWIAKGATRDTVALEGHLVEWEWIHVAATSHLLEPRLTTLPATSTQDAFRFVPGLLVAALRGPAAGIYGAALVATLVAWAGATAAVASLASHVWRDGTRESAARARLGLLAGAVLMAQGTGYIAFLGNVDAHQFGYAAVALWCGAWLVFAPHEPARTGSSLARSAAAGLALCIAGLTMEVAYPLLLSAWLLFAASVMWRVLRPGDALVRAVTLTAAFAVPFVAFQLLMRVSLGPKLVPLNDPLAQLGAQLLAAREQGPLWWGVARMYQLVERWPLAFPLPVSALAMVGLFVTPRRWLAWSLLTLLPLLAAIVLTKLLVRTVFLVHPPVYVLAATGAAWLAERAGTLAPRVSWLPLAVLSALMLAVSLVTNADLWGDYHIPTWWWRIQ